MSLYPRIKLFTGSLIWPSGSAWVGVLGGALVAASTYTLWSSWISRSQRRQLAGPANDTAVEPLNETATDEGGNTSSHAGRPPGSRARGTSARNMRPPAAEYPLQILHEDPDATVDIVAVHGLGAAPDYAWVWLPKNNPPGSSGYPDKPYNWLRELMRLHNRGCRVMAFNYDSRWISNALQQRLSDISGTLLGSVRNKREETAGVATHRPLIFIGHSFGGNIIEQALVTASRHHSDFLSIAESTVGIVFLGTPHRGCDAAAWGYLVASLAPPGFVTEKRLLMALEKETDAMVDRLRDFSTWLFSESVPVVCVCEKELSSYASRLGVVGKYLPFLFRTLVVPESTACIDGHRKISLDADHFKINKFYGPYDPSFILLHPEIQRMAHDAEIKVGNRLKPKDIPTDPETVSENLKKSGCLKRMRVKDPLDVLKDVRDLKGKRLGNSCAWILKRPEFSVWGASDKSQLLRLVGSPGIGKTMMSTFLVDILRGKVEKTPDKAFAYFFCDDKIQSRKTPTAILRSLVWQLLLQWNDLFEHIKPELDKHADEYLFVDLFDQFSPMWRVFQSMLRDARIGEVFILIDALDECEESTRKDLLGSIADLFLAPPGEGMGKVKFLVTCRPEISDIETQLKGVGVFLRMDSADINNDLASYVEFHVGDLAKRKGYNNTLEEKVGRALKGGHGGTFLWVSLMIAELEGTLLHQVEEKLRRLPRELDDTYAAILDRIPAENRETAKFILGCMVAANRPLKRLEIQAGFAAKIVMKDSSTSTRQDLSIYADICSTCSSILFESQTKSGHADDATMTFCHQSVKDFLLRSVSGSDRKWYCMSVDEANLFIFTACWAYLSSKDFHYGGLVVTRRSWYGEMRWVKQKLIDLQHRFHDAPFLKYAYGAWEDHAMASYPAICEASIDFARASPLRDYLLLSAVLRGHREIVQFLCDVGADIEARDSSGQTPLIRAARSGSAAVLGMLLDREADKEASDSGRQRALHWAAKHENTIVVDLLLAKGADKDAKDWNGWRPLHCVAKKGHRATVESLLKSGADPEPKDDAGWTPLHWAAENGHMTVVGSLLDRVVDRDARDKGGWTPLHRAARSGRAGVTSLLLERGADMEAKDHDRAETPLYWAVANGAETVVEVLLNYGADIQTRNKFQSTALHRAVVGGRKKITQLLLKRGADLNARDSENMTPVDRALQHKGNPMIQVLRPWTMG